MRPIASFLCMLALSVCALAQETRPALTVMGDVKTPLKLSVEELHALPRTTLKAKDHEGQEHEYEGVLLVEVLKKAGVPLGEDLRGPAMATYVMASAVDGYQAVFALPELDPSFKEQTVLLADKEDGKNIIFYRGPLRLVVPGDKKHARWVRQVDSLKVVQLPKLKPRDTP